MQDFALKWRLEQIPLLPLSPPTTILSYPVKYDFLNGKTAVTFLIIICFVPGFVIHSYHYFIPNQILKFLSSIVFLILINLFIYSECGDFH